ncbi:MAG: pirin family protein [Actinomycetota bacterium]|nr:pirin family protein [Actinomycetota bacterium]
MRATTPGWGGSASAGHCRCGHGAPSARGASATTWAGRGHRDLGLDIGPHPHIGLQTVTWLLTGEVLHRDSLGTEQVVAPGQLNLMTAGRGLSHSEEATGAYRGEVHGMQLWVAQPEHTRTGEPAFEQLADLPVIELDRTPPPCWSASSPAPSAPRHDSPLLGADLALRPGTTVPLSPGFEHALVVLEGAVTVDDRLLEPGRLGYLGRSRDELVLSVAEPTRALLLDGEPLDEPVVMWWNFVARGREELDQAYADWDGSSERFGTVASALPRVPAPRPVWRRPG